MSTFGSSSRAARLLFSRRRLISTAVMLWLATVTGCSNVNKGLSLPKAGGPIPVSGQHAPTEAERAYWSQLAPARVIYIAETHSSNADHEYELEVLKGLKVRGTKFAIGWEMFDSTQQAVLDTWNLHRLSTDVLLDKTDFQRHWGVYSVMYEKILRWTQTEEISSLALNAPGELSKKLAQGLPLDPVEQGMLPVGYQPLPGGFEHFSEQMGEAPHADANLANFYNAQLLWDQTIAARVVTFLAANPDEKLVVLLGRGHVDGGFGVPAFVRQKTDAPQLIVYPRGVPVEQNSQSPGRVVSLGKTGTDRLLWLVRSRENRMAVSVASTYALP